MIVNDAGSGHCVMFEAVMQANGEICLLRSIHLPNDAQIFFQTCQGQLIVQFIHAGLTRYQIAFHGALINWQSKQLYVFYSHRALLRFIQRLDPCV